MAEENNEPEQASTKSSGPGIVMWLIMVIVAVGGGVAAPILIGQMGGSTDAEEVETPAEPDPDEEVVFIEFDEVTVNLDEARFSRYLRINFSLQVAKSQEIDVTALVEAKKAILKNWLQVHVSEKSTDDLRGKFGRNRLRREMLDYFNKVLFTDGIERIQDVLFREFHVQ